METINENKTFSSSKEKEYKNKISELEKLINELQLKIKENDNLKGKIIELQNILTKQNKIIIELENEIKIFRKYCNFSETEKLLSIKFISGEQDIDYTIIAKNTENFSILENSIYNEYPQYRETENYFLINGKKINKHKTLEQNKINNNDIITLFINNLD